MGKKVTTKKLSFQRDKNGKFIPSRQNFKNLLFLFDGDKGKVRRAMMGLEIYKISQRKKFETFSRGFTKQEVIEMAGGVRDKSFKEVTDFAKFIKVKPDEIMNFLVNKSLNKTDQKTVRIKAAYNSINSKLKKRSKILNNKNKFIKIDPSLNRRAGEERTSWDERIYQRVFKAIQRS